MPPTQSTATARKPRAVGLLSGGLDSILACRMMIEQGIEVFAVNFTGPHYSDTGEARRFQASRTAASLGIPLKVMATGQEFVEMLKHPKHGRGSGMNPCIDCRIFTFVRARAFADEIGADFLFSGEVLGERPMSQHMQSLRVIEKESGLEGRMLRPLSALLLEPTRAELSGIVDRSKLKAIQGRSRKPQMEMAAAYGIREYPTPAGGCLLTDAVFSARLRDAFAHGEDKVADMPWLHVGRHFRLVNGVKIVVGRNEAENEVLRRLARPGDEVVEVADFVGPVTVVLSPLGASDIRTAGRLCVRYSDGRGHGVIRVKHGDNTFEAGPPEEAEINAWRVGK